VPLARSARRIRSSRHFVESLETRRMLDASYVSLAAGPLTQDWSNKAQIAVANDWSGVPGIVGYQGDGLTLPAGSDPRVVTSGTLGTVNVTPNLTNPSIGSGGGVSEFEIANPVVAIRGSGTAVAPSLVLYLDTTATVGTQVAFDLRDIDGSANNTTQQVAVQYRIGATGSFQNVPGSYVNDATRGPSLATLVTHVGVALPSDADNQPQVQVRILTTNAQSTDEWVGVDNIDVAASPAIAAGTFNFASVASRVDESAGEAVVRVTRTGGSTGAASVSYAATGGTASNASDYSLAPGTLDFADGETFKDITIPIVNDNLLEGDETVLLALSAPTGGAAVGNTASATLTIADDETTLSRLNEVLVNPDGTDNPFEFIEVRGVPGAPLLSLYVVGVNGVAGSTLGVTNFAEDLSSAHFGANGLLVIKAANGGPTIPGVTTVVADRFLEEQPNLSNNAVSFLLIASPTPIYAGTDLDTNDDGTLDLPTGSAVLDAVGWSDGGVGSVVYGGVSLTQSSGTPDAATRFPHDLRPSTAAAWFNGDVVSNTPANPSGLVYDPVKNSGNVPLNAALTPGDVNFSTSGSNAAPTSIDAAYSTQYATSVDIPASTGVLVNDADPDGDPIAAILDSGVDPASGTLSLGLDGSFTFVPAAGFHGDAAFTYHASDGSLSSPISTVTITVGLPPDQPPYITAPTQAQVIDEDMTLAFAAASSNTIQVGDPDAGTDPVQVTLAVSGGTLTLSGTSGLSFTTGDGTSDVQMAFTGTLVDLNAALLGLSYTPDANINGSDTLLVMVDDLGHNGPGGPLTDSVTVPISITPVNDPPVAVGDAASGTEDTPLTINVLSNDSDVDNDPLTVIIDTGPTHGTAEVNADGTVLYTPVANYNGKDSFTYHDFDGNLASGTVTVTVDLAAVNDPPVAVADSAGGTEDTPLTIDVLANDSDVDNDPLTVIIDTGPTHGTAEVNADGTVLYTPAANYNGKDSFTYHVFDGTVASPPATVSISLSPVNDAPVARDDTSSTGPGFGLPNVTIDVLANDSDVDGDPLSVEIVAAPEHGTVSVDPDGKVEFSPSSTFGQTDHFTYRVSDGKAESNIATVNITILQINTGLAPTIVGPADPINATEGSVLTFQVQAQDADSPLSSLRYSFTDNFASTHPGATIDPVSGVFSWQPTNGPADVPVAIAVSDMDTYPHTTTRTFSIHVANVAPVVAPIANATLQTGGTLSLGGSFTDPGTDTWAATVDYGDGSGTSSLALGANKQFALNHTYAAAGQFTAIVRVTDNDGQAGESRFTVAVTPPIVSAPALQLSIKKGVLSRAFLTFGAAINPASGTYSLVRAGRDKKFGTKDDISIRLKPPSYDASTHVVTIATRKRLALGRASVRLSASGLTDALGRPVDGDGDGKPGGSFIAYFSHRGLTTFRVGSRRH
jgi:Bacterial Ig domain/Calx-beta domain/PKD domain